MVSTRVRAVRPRVCTVCRRRIEAGDVYKRFTVTDQFGVVVIHKACLHHDTDTAETDTRTRAMKRLTIDELEKLYPPREGDAPEDGGVTDPIPADSYRDHPLGKPGVDNFPDGVVYEKSFATAAEEMAYNPDLQRLTFFLWETDTDHHYGLEHWAEVAKQWLDSQGG